MNNLDKNFYITEKDLVMFFLNSQEQLDWILKRGPGKAEMADFIFVHNDIKGILKTEPYINIWFAATLILKKTGKIYYYNE